MSRPNRIGAARIGGQRYRSTGNGLSVGPPPTSDRPGNDIKGQSART